MTVITGPILDSAGQPANGFLYVEQWYRSEQDGTLVTDNPAKGIVKDGELYLDDGVTPLTVPASPIGGGTRMIEDFRPFTRQVVRNVVVPENGPVQYATLPDVIAPIGSSTFIIPGILRSFVEKADGVGDVLAEVQEIKSDVVAAVEGFDETVNTAAAVIDEKAAEIDGLLATNDGIMTAVAEDPDSGFAAILDARLAAEVSPFTETLGQFEGQPLQVRSHSWGAANTNATPNLRAHERIVKRLGMGAITNKGVSGRTIGDITNLALGGADVWAPRTKALGYAVCTINDITLFDGSAASRRGYGHAWRALLSIMTANSAVPSNTTTFVYGPSWSSETVTGSQASPQGATPNSSGGTRWLTSTPNDPILFTFSGADVDVFLVARAVGAGVATFKEGATVLGTLDLTAAVAQDCPAVFRIRGRGAGTHTISVELTSGASLTIDSIRIPSTAPIPILVLGEPPVIPTSGDHSTYLADVETFKGDLASICAEFPTVKYLDLNLTGWDTASMLSDDGKHPNDHGCAWIASRSIEKLAELPYLTGLNVLAAAYPSAYVSPAGPAIPEDGSDGTGVTPSKVSALTIGTVTSNSVALSWTAPAISGVTDYSVQYRIIGAGSWTTFAHAVSTATTATVTGLDTVANSYEFQVAAKVGSAVKPYSSPARMGTITPGYLSRYRASTLAGSVGDVITSWTDETGVAAFTGAAGPTLRVDGNGVRYLEFDGVDDELQRVMPSDPFTVFIVGRRRAGAGVSFMTGKDGGNPNHTVGISSGGAFIANSGTVLGTRAADNNLHVITAVFNGASSVIAIDGQADESGTIGANATGTLLALARTLGGAHFALDIYEIVIQAGVLPSADRVVTAAGLKSSNHSA